MDKSLCIAMVSNGKMEVRTCFCLIQAVSQLTIPITAVSIEGCYVHRNRNEALAQAMKLGVTHILFVDSDMAFEKDAIQKLLDADKDIVGANYNKRQLPLTPIVKDGLSDNLFQTDFVPGGLMLIKLSILEELGGSWFGFDSTKDLNDDDKFFCYKALEAGYEVWCDPTIKVGHIGQYIY